MSARWSSGGRAIVFVAAVAWAAACGAVSPATAPPAPEIADEIARCGHVTERLALARAQHLARADVPVAPPLDVGPIADVTLGGAGACARSRSGKVVCWSVDSTFVGLEWTPIATIAEPWPREGLADVAEIGVGGSHACARLADGTIACWGDSAEGRLGTTKVGDPLDPAEARAPRRVDLVRDAVKLTVGEAHACIARADGTVSCWGANAHGETGGSGDLDEVPIQVDGVRDVVDVAALDDGTCARTRKGEVWCWGARPDAERDPAPRKIDVTASGELVAGGRVACAVEATALKCWGATGSLSDDAAAVVTIALPRRARSVALDGTSVCAIWEDGTTGCHGELARWLSGAPDERGWVALPGDAASDAAAITIGRESACVVDAKGAVRCIGDRRMLGRFAYEASSPVSVVDVDGAAGVTVGAARACALGDGRARCWGDDREGLFGVVRGPVDALAIGPTRTCALADGKVRCGEIARGAQPAVEAEDVPLAGLATSLAIGDDHACVSTTDGSVWCWGASPRGAIGALLPLGERAKEPRRIDGLPPAAAVSAAGETSCALLRAGAVWCWGANGRGQLGNGTFAESGSPGPVVGVDGATSVSMGAELGCARTASGAVRCWGNGAVASMPWEGVDAVDMSVGSDEACVVLSDARVACGMPGCSAIIPGVEGATRIGVGPWSACAVVEGGRVRCWGSLRAGLLGDGSLDRARRPGLVLPRPAP